jgi:hypothetical protein
MSNFPHPSSQTLAAIGQNIVELEALDALTPEQDKYLESLYDELENR